MIDLGVDSVAIGGMALLPEDGLLKKVINGRTFLRSGVVADTAAYPNFPAAAKFKSIGMFWETKDMPSTEKWRSVAKSPAGLYVASAAYDSGNNSASYVAISADGVTWARKALPSALKWGDVIFANGLFVMCQEGELAGVYTSTDGITWTQRTTDVPATSSGAKLAYGNGMFVLMCSSTSWLTSPDGITWTKRTALPGTYWGSVIFAGGKFVAVNGNLTQSGSLSAVSNDGITWVTGTMPLATTWRSLAYGAGKYVAAAGATLAYSSDGLAWTKVVPPRTDVTITNVIFTDGMFIAFYSGGAFISTDGIEWGQRGFLSGTLPVAMIADGTDLFGVGTGYSSRSKQGIALGAQTYAPNLYLRVA